MILDDVQWVAERSHHVAIDRGCLDKVCARIDPARLYLPDWQVPVVPVWRDERLVDFFFLFNSINFCYWGEPKWTVQFHGASYDGAFGMMAALTRALEEGYPLLDGDFLVRLTREQFRHIFPHSANLTQSNICTTL